MIFAVTAVLLLSSLAAADILCTSQGGTCLDWINYKCTAGYEIGLCNGDSNRKCCNECDDQCKALEEDYAQGDGDCTSSGGECQDNSNYCPYSYKSGMCGGPSSRQCCTQSSSSGGECSLVEYSSLYIKGYNGLRVEVEPGFLYAMDNMNTFARQCFVTVYVTHAFREEGQSIGGEIVPPATYSNHLVGHAIDFNLDTPNGWCNGDCMYAGYDSYSECFIQNVMNSGLHWGGIWNPSDPVHIDDWYNNDMNKWNDLYYEVQGACV